VIDPFMFWAICLLLLGLVLLGSEFFIPSAGVLSVLAIVVFIAAAICGFLVNVKFGLLILILEGVLTPALAYIAIRFWPHSPMGRLILIPRPEHQDDVLPEGGAFLHKDFVGRIGMSKTKLLPAGAITIEGRVYDAISEGTAIESGVPVKIIGVETNHLVVRATRNAKTPSIEATSLEDFEFEDDG